MSRRRVILLAAIVAMAVLVVGLLSVRSEVRVRPDDVSASPFWREMRPPGPSRASAR